MAISISNLTINNNEPAGTLVGVLTAQDGPGTVIPCNFILTKNSAGFFAISGNSLATARASISAGYYSVRVRTNGTNTKFSGNAVFTIAVTVAAPPPPPPPPPPSPNGTIIYGGQAGSLVTAEGTWTFSVTHSADGVDWSTLLDGVANGTAVQMEVANNGNLYVYSARWKRWFERQNGKWMDVGAVAPDGMIIYGGGPGVLTTSDGTWSFGPNHSADGIDWPILLNGVNVNGGTGIRLQITNGYLYDYSGRWHEWFIRQNAAWIDVGKIAPVEGSPPTPTAITLLPANARIPDNAPAGTVVATAHVIMSDGSLFTGTLTTSNTSLFAISGLNIVTARALKSADHGSFSTVITASQGSQSFSMELSA